MSRPAQSNRPAQSSRPQAIRQAQNNETTFFEDLNKSGNLIQAITEHNTLELNRKAQNLFPAQWQLLKFIARNPEKADIIENPLLFDREPRSFFEKLRQYIKDIDEDFTAEFDEAVLRTRFETIDDFSYQSDFEEAEEITEYKARKIVSALQSFNVEKEKIQNASLYLMAKDNEEAALHAQRMLSGCKEAPIDVEVFSTDDSPDPNIYTLSKDGVPVLEDNNFYVVMGREKSGKSHILSVLLASYLFGGVDSFGFTSMIEKPEVLYIDTEQSKADALQICQTANILGGRPYNAKNDNLKICSCDDVPSERLIEKIEELVIKHRPKVLFIDGYAGLIPDAYKTAGADATMRSVRSMARRHHLVIIGVFHVKAEQKTPDGKKAETTAFGAFGKLFERYGGGTFEVTNEEGFIMVENVRSRKNTCPTFYCDMIGRIYVDKPGSAPDCYEIESGNAEAVLRPLDKTINDRDVHIFGVPHVLTEASYYEGADVREIKEDMKKEERRLQKEEIRIQASQPKLKTLFSLILSPLYKEGHDNFFEEKEIQDACNDYYRRQNGLLKEDPIPPKARTDFSKKRTEAKKCGLFRTVPSGKIEFILSDDIKGT